MARDLGRLPAVRPGVQPPTARERAARAPSEPLRKPGGRGSFTVERLLPALRLAVKHRREMLNLIHDNGGAIYTVVRISAVLCERGRFPELTHVNNYKHSEDAEISVAAYAARKRGGFRADGARDAVPSDLAPTARPGPFSIVLLMTEAITRRAIRLA